MVKSESHLRESVYILPRSHVHDENHTQSMRLQKIKFIASLMHHKPPHRVSHVTQINSSATEFTEQTSEKNPEDFVVSVAKGSLKYKFPHS